MRERFEKAGITALFQAAVLTQVLQGYLLPMHLNHYIFEIESIDILDCNAENYGYPFATKFQP